MNRNFLVLLFWGLVFFLLMAVQASANPAHDHGTISPFDKQKHTHELYCVLNKHHSSNVFCPHSISEKNKQRPVIASDCGGKSSGTIPAVGSYNVSVFLSDPVLLNAKLAIVSWKFTSTFYGLGFSLAEQIDHPPKTT